MKQEIKTRLEVPLFPIIFFIIGIIGAVWFSNLMSNHLKRSDIKYIIESCKKNKHFFYDNTIFKCEAQE